VEPNAIQFISLGAMRYFKELKAEMKRRFPGTMLLEGPFTRGPDGKSRYFRPVREEIFETISAMILEQDPKQWLYFCMEGKNTWKNVFNLKVDHRKNLDKFFKMRRQGNSERLIALPGQDKT
jgi:spore photoproduct lyase